MGPSKFSDFLALLWLVTQATQCDSEKKKSNWKWKIKTPSKEKLHGNSIPTSSAIRTDGFLQKEKRIIGPQEVIPYYNRSNN